MTPPLFTACLRSASDTAAEIELLGPNGALAVNWSGAMHGPACLYARTLPNEYRITGGRVVISEPCYWSPRLPFLYDMTLRGEDAEGEVREVKQLVGFRRLAIRRQSLYWDSRRVVLRGMRATTLTAELADATHAVAAMLILPTPLEAQRELGDRAGVGIIADLRGSAPTIDELNRLASHSSVAIMLADRQPVFTREFDRLPSVAILAAVVTSDGPESAPEWSNAVAVELNGAERPPPWLVGCGKPVIAIRRGGAYADIHAARAACDRLQAELAPEFDLAGYFVDA